MAKPDKIVESPLVENALEKTSREDQGAASKEEEAPSGGLKLADLAARVLAGDLSLAEAAQMAPTVIHFLQARVGNAMVEKLLRGGESDKAEEQGDPPKAGEEAGDQGKSDLGTAGKLGLGLGLGLGGAGASAGAAVIGAVKHLGLGRHRAPAGPDQADEVGAPDDQGPIEEVAPTAPGSQGPTEELTPVSQGPTEELTPVSQGPTEELTPVSQGPTEEVTPTTSDTPSTAPQVPQGGATEQTEDGSPEDEGGPDDQGPTSTEGDVPVTDDGAPVIEDKTPEGGDGGEVVPEDKTEAPKEEEAPGSEEEVVAEPQGPVPAGGGGSEPAPEPAPAPAPPAPVVDSGPGGTIAEYMAANPDSEAAERVESIAQLNDKVARQANGLSGKIDLPPDKAWYDAVTPRQEWFKFKQGVLGKNKWTGQDRGLDVMTRVMSALDFISSAASKIGLAATVGGAILTFLVPPVGAFLLAVGRVCNAISAACAVFKLVGNIVKTVMLAVKAAKEKDPHKRMELLQEMKASVQGAVTAGIEVIINKIAGGAKGGAKTAGSKGMDATKAAWKGAREQGKNVVASGKAALGAGYQATKEGLKTSVKEGTKKLKEMGVKGTLKAGYEGTKKGLKDNLVKPLTDVPKAFAGAKIAYKDMVSGSFGQAIKANGGGLAGYTKTLGQMNFPNATNASGWKEKVKGTAKDLTDTSGGGYATRIHMGMNVDKSAEDRAKLTGDGPKSELEVSAYAKKQADSRVKWESAQTREEKEALLKGDDTSKSLSHLDDSTVDVLFRDQKRDTLAGQSLIGVKGSNLANGLDVGKAAYGAATNTDQDWSDVVKTGLSKAGPAGGTASKFMVGSKTPAERASAQDSFIKQVESANNANTSAAVKSMVKLPAESTTGVTAAKVDAALGSVLPTLTGRKDALRAAMAQEGASPGGDEGGSTLPPPPPAPPEGTLVPSEDVIAQARAERSKVSGIRAQINKDVEQAKELKEQAIAGDGKLAEYAAGLDQQSGEIAQQKQEASQDKDEITQAGAQIKESGAELGNQKGAAEDQKSKADDKASEGGSVTAEPDNAKYEAEQKKKADDDKRKWDAEYARAGKIKKAKMWAKRALFSIGNLLKSAAKWVWKKMIEPAIKAVKKALGKVMNYITNLLMSGIMKIVKLFLSEEDAARLDESMAQMKEMEAEQAKQKADETEQANAEVKMDLTKAQQAAKSKIDTCQANISEGTTLLGQLDSHDQALEAEAAKLEAQRSAFIAQYTPYFDWVKLKEEHDAKQGSESGGESEGGEAATQHPADRPLEPIYGQAIANAADAVGEDSLAAQQEVTQKAGEQLGVARGKAQESFFATTSEARYLAGEHGIDPAPVFDDQTAKSVAIKGAAQQVRDTVTSSLGQIESERRGRLDAIKAQAQGLTGMPLAAGLELAKKLYEQLAAEAKGLDEAKAKAIADLNEGFTRAMAAEG